MITSPAARADQAAADPADACFTSAERAQPLMKQGRLREARAELEMCARDVCPRLARDDCRAWLAEVVAAQPSILIAAHEVRGTVVRDVHGVKAIVDGAIVADNADTVPVVLDPGPHRLRLERAGAEPVDQAIDVRVGEKAKVVHVYWRAPASPAAPAPADSGARDTPELVYGLGALGVAAVGVGAALEIASLSKRAELDSTCRAGHDCQPSQVDSARDLARAGDITLGAGLLVVACTAYLYFARPFAVRPARPARGAALVWSVGPMRGGVTGAVIGAW